MLHNFVEEGENSWIQASLPTQKKKKKKKKTTEDFTEKNKQSNGIMISHLLSNKLKQKQ